MSTVDTIATTRPRRISFVAGLTLLYLLLALILLVVGLRVWQSTYQASEDNAWVAHTYDVEILKTAVAKYVKTN